MKFNVSIDYEIDETIGNFLNINDAINASIEMMNNNGNNDIIEHIDVDHELHIATLTMETGCTIDIYPARKPSIWR